MNIVNHGGRLTRYGDPGHKRLWDIQWDTAEAVVKEEAAEVGLMHAVKGTIYKKDGSQTTFSAEEASAQKDKNVLTLSGSVVLTSMKPKGTLKCEKVVWYGDDELIEANGKIAVDTPGYSVSGIDKMLAKPDFSEIGSPDTFEEKKKVAKTK